MTMYLLMHVVFDVINSSVTNGENLVSDGAVVLYTSHNCFPRERCRNES